MKLNDWMAREGVTQERLAELLSKQMEKKVRQPLVSTWCRGKARRPESSYIWAIHQVTKGEVTLADWFEAPAAPAPEAAAVPLASASR